MSKETRGVPDAIHHTNPSESLEYITGWNDCRAAMLAEQPAQQEPDELRHIGEQDCLLDVDENAWYSLVENRGGCRCHISPPCGACSNPISEEEMNEVGYTYTTPQAQRTWVGLTAKDWNVIGFTAEFRAGAEWANDKLKEKNT